MAECIVAEDLTADALRSLVSYDPETGVFIRLKTVGSQVKGSVAGFVTGDGYVKIKINRKEYFAHRLAWLYVYGEWPSLFIDHINRSKADNRIQNLRDVERCVNGRNRDLLAHNTSGRAGVTWIKRNRYWRARANKNGKRIHLGDFHNKEDAIKARESWESRNPIETPSSLIC